MRIHTIKFSFLLSLFTIVSIPIAAENDAVKVLLESIEQATRGIIR